MTGAPTSSNSQTLTDGETNPTSLAALADKKLRANAGTIVRRAERLHGAQPGLLPAPEDGTGGIAISMIPRRFGAELRSELPRGPLCGSRLP